MLTGNLKCTEINKLFLRYISFDLSKNDMARVAIHLRNCPNCMDKYTKIQKRKRDLKRKMYKIEKLLRMQEEVSTFYDKEGGKDLNLIVGGMLAVDEKYKKELEDNEKLSKILKKCKRELENKSQNQQANKVMQIIFRKKENALIQQPFQFLRRVLLRWQ